jgi:hypothetical protein
MRTCIFVLALISSTTFAQTKKKTTTTKKTTTPAKTTKSVTATKPKTTTTTKSVVPTNLSSVASTISSATSSISQLSDSDIISGLKEALSLGAKNASSQLNALDGFNKNLKVRIPFPSEAQMVADKLREYGMGKQIDDFEVTLNRAAEQAAKDAAPIFVNAITQMNITDAKNILQGSSNGATTYLQGKTTDALTTAFSPTIKAALGNTLATSKWTEITSLYNKIPFTSPVETDLTKYTTNLALKGLFTVVGDEEKKIRENPVARTSEILQKVFGSVGK